MARVTLGTVMKIRGRAWCGPSPHEDTVSYNLYGHGVPRGISPELFADVVLMLGDWEYVKAFDHVFYRVLSRHGVVWVRSDALLPV